MAVNLLGQGKYSISVVKLICRYQNIERKNWFVDGIACNLCCKAYVNNVLIIKVSKPDSA